jgi:hypothetical protein
MPPFRKKMNARLDFDAANLPPIARERDLLRVVGQRIAERLPPGWSAEMQTVRGTPERGFVALTLKTPTGEPGLLAVQAKLALEPRDVESLLGALESGVGAERSLVVSRFLSPRTRELLDDAGVSYADATGTVRLTLDRPGLFIDARGAETNPWREERELRSLKGRTASRIVRALCDYRPPVGVRELAQRAAASNGATVRTLDLLEREALIARDERKRVTGVDIGQLIERWSQDFRFTRQNAIVRCFEPRRLDALLDRLRGTSVAYAITGSFAANELAPYADPRLLALYVEDADAMAEQLGVREPRGPSNVWLASPPDDLPFERVWERDGLRYAAPIQVACDLLDMPGRSPAEAQELLRFLESDPDAWRTD